MNSNRILVKDNGGVQFKYDVNVHLEIDNDTIVSIREFNEKHNVRLNADRLPFSTFECSNRTEYSMDELAEYEPIFRHIAKANGRTEEEIEVALESFNKEKIKDAKCSVSIENGEFIVDLDGDCIIKGDIVNDDVECLEDCLTEVRIGNISENIAKTLADDDIADKFRNYALFTLSNMLHLISFLSYNNKVENRELFDFVHSNVIMDSKSTKKKKGKKKSSKRKRIIKVSKLTITKDKVNNVKYTRPYERKTDSWFAAGHERRYKSGKVVWIKPTVKRAKGVKPNSNTINQDYVVKQ